MEQIDSIIKRKERPLSILLVEDDDGDAKAFTRAFKKAEIPVSIVRAIDGIEGIEILRSEKGASKLSTPALIVADINMPRLDGISFVKEIRRDKNLNSSIIFLLTTSRNISDIKRGYELNVAGYFTKQKAGYDYARLAQLLKEYWKLVEMPLSVE